LKNITRKLIGSLVLLASAAFASSKASASFVYELGKMTEAELETDVIHFNAKILFQNPLSFHWKSTDIRSDGGKIVLLTAGFPFRFSSFSWKPSFLFAAGVWDKGDFEYFYGKPDLPRVFGSSLDAEYAFHRFGADFLSGNAKLLNNTEDAELFDADFYLYHAFYGLHAGSLFKARAGFAGFKMEALGALTAGNQRYFLFPYAYYQASGTMNAKAVYGTATVSLESNFLKYGIDLGIFYLINGKIRGNMHYQYRKFFGDDEVYDTIHPVELKNSGLLFSVLSIKTRKIKIGKIYAAYGIQKPLVYPFGRIFPKGGKTGSSDASSIKEAILWGLSAHIEAGF
jgi:hypothetical protein